MQQAKLPSAPQQGCQSQRQSYHQASDACVTHLLVDGCYILAHIFLQLLDVPDETAAIVLEAGVCCQRYEKAFALYSQQCMACNVPASP